MKNKQNYDKKQLEELKEINLWFVINTIFTILTGIATVFIGVLELMKH